MDIPALVNDKLVVEFKPRYNHYICDTCNQITAVIELDEGVAPMFIGCRKCKVKEARCQSMFYGCPQIEQRVDFEFFRLKPMNEGGIWTETNEQFQQRLFRLTEEDRLHHNQGGLFMRPYDPPLRFRQKDIIKVYYKQDDPKTVYLVRNAIKQPLYQDCLIVCHDLGEDKGYQISNIIEQQLPPGCVQTHWSPGTRE